MSAKYATGARVRIVGRHRRWQSWDSDIWMYENLTGKVVASRAVVGYLAPWGFDRFSEIQTIHSYTIRLDLGIEVEGITEECLEEIR